MSGATEALENAILDALLGASATLLGATVYVGLLLVAADDDGTGGTEVSTSGTAYARIAVANNGTSFPAASAGVKTNAIALEWATATADWGEVIGWGIWDAASAGNLKLQGELDVARDMLDGDEIKFLPGELEITVD